MSFLTLLTLLSFHTMSLALPQTTEAPVCFFCGSVGTSSVEPLSSLYSKYATVSGFDDFTSQLDNKLLKFIMTQTYISDISSFTATDNLEAATTNPSISSFTKALVSEVTKFAATETYLPQNDRDRMASEFASFLEVESGGATPTETILRPSATVQRPSSPTVQKVTGVTPLVATQTVKETVGPLVTGNLAKGNAALSRAGMLSVSGMVVGMVVAMAVVL
ncbi:hypothetical protein BDD12DRAFT_856440 [Trichophaea hybrida]|nr:hypothetical protein BDD12DRAFT_856440 [Trichophaea hybrida]